MSDWIVDLTHRYSGRGALVDTNILLLYVVGQFDPSQIARHGRTRQFTPADFRLLANLLRRFGKIVTTPCILAEVSNLSKDIKEPARTSLFQQLAREIERLDEQYAPSATVARADHFPRLGLTDSGILKLAKDACLVLTDDLVLASFLEKSKIDVLNFNHLRQLSWST